MVRWRGNKNLLNYTTILSLYIYMYVGTKLRQAHLNRYKQTKNKITFHITNLLLFFLFLSRSVELLYLARSWLSLCAANNPVFAAGVCVYKSKEYRTHTENLKRKPNVFIYFFGHFKLVTSESHYIKVFFVRVVFFFGRVCCFCLFIYISERAKGKI